MSDADLFFDSLTLDSFFLLDEDHPFVGVSSDVPIPVDSQLWSNQTTLSTHHYTVSARADMSPSSHGLLPALHPSFGFSTCIAAAEASTQDSSCVMELDGDDEPVRAPDVEGCIMELDDDDEPMHTADVEGDQTQPSAANTCPSSKASFATLKEKIHALYMEENYALPAVMALMSAKHEFAASKKMYKTQFERWGWKKYETRKLQDGPKSSSLRPLGERKGKGVVRRSRFHDKPAASPYRALLHANDLNRDVFAFLTATTQYLEGIIDKDEKWKTTPRTEYVATNSWTFYTLLFSAVKYFTSGENILGGRFARRAFEEIADGIVRCDYDMFFELCFDVPDLLQRQSQFGLLRSLLSFVSQLAQRMLGPVHPLSRTTAAVRNLFEATRTGEDCQIDDFIIQGETAWMDVVHRVRGGVDRDALHLWNRSSRQPTRRQLENMSFGVDQLILMAKLNRDVEASLEIETIFLSLQWRHDIYIPGYMQRVAALMSSFRCHILNSSAPLWYFRLYFDLLGRWKLLSLAEPVSEPMEAVLDISARLDQLSLDDADDVLNILVIRDRLRYVGLHQDAERFHQRWESSAFVRYLEERYGPEEDAFREGLAPQALDGDNVEGLVRDAAGS